MIHLIPTEVIMIHLIPTEVIFCSLHVPSLLAWMGQQAGHFAKNRNLELSVLFENVKF